MRGGEGSGERGAKGAKAMGAHLGGGAEAPPAERRPRDFPPLFGANAFVTFAAHTV